MTAVEEALPEVDCPGCGATIRARMADGPAQGARVAQLEKVVELARTVVRTSSDHPAASALAEAIWLMDLALTTLDYPGTAPGPHCAAVAQEIASPAVAQERASRARWGAWRHLRTSIKED